MHQTDAGPVVRALLPNAAHVTRDRACRRRDCSANSNNSRRAVCRPCHVRGAVSSCGSTGMAWCRKSRTRIRSAPCSATNRLGRLAGGDPYAVLECLGSRPMEVDGVPGVRFAVWAPNARRVSVVGDFNAWDGRRHPMRLRHQAGVWELFVPRVGPGTRYKYELLSRDGHPLPLKADPCAMQTEKPPGTASVVAHVDEIEQFRVDRPRLDSVARREADAARADLDLRSACRILAACRRRRPTRARLGRTRRAADAVREEHGLHARGVHADRRASVRRFVGLSAARAVRAVRALRQARAVRAASSTRRTKPDSA